MHVQDVWRLSNSPSGNPNYQLLTTDGHTYRSAPDSNAGFQMPNLKDGDEITLTFDSKGRITYVTKVS